jgi:hypothetical protein|tara:strand:- start:167 stop:328 length:162 start_codon:yes stop_codon:yes gene_type:complete
MMMYGEHKMKLTKEKIIDPKNPKHVGSSWANLGNHVLIIGFIACLAFVVYASY